MRITQFTVGASRTMNLGNFNSLRIEASVTTDLNDGDDRAIAETQAQSELRHLLEQTYRNMKPDKVPNDAGNR